VRFLVDENLSPRLCDYLTTVEDTAEHVHDALRAGTSDEDIFDHAVEQDMVVVTADTDFGTLLALAKISKPSVILVRELLSLTVAEQGPLLAANLPQIRETLEEGAIVVFSLTDIRVRPLPIA
jgi:predicted nuclease of predicted toxin-antitoxin system